MRNTNKSTIDFIEQKLYNLKDSQVKYQLDINESFKKFKDKIMTSFYKLEDNVNFNLEQLKNQMSNNYVCKSEINSSFKKLQ